MSYPRPSPEARQTAADHVRYRLEARREAAKVERSIGRHNPRGFLNNSGQYTPVEVLTAELSLLDALIEYIDAL